jgi:methionine synthase II (cobalamin-independent)
VIAVAERLGATHVATIDHRHFRAVRPNALEPETGVLARIAEATRHKPLLELTLSTQCGFASVPAANPVTSEGQRSKLEMVVRLARRVWG